MTVAVTARDAFGAAVPDAAITLYYSSGIGFWETRTRTDANGQAQVENTPRNVYGVSTKADALFGASYEAVQADQQRMAFNVTLHPYAPHAPGLGRVAVTDISGDARRLTFNARLYVVPTYADESFWYLGGVDVEPCEPQVGTPFVDDCVGGPGGFTAAYTGSSLSDDPVEPNPVSDPLAIALLLDQGEAVAVNDPADKRLLAARYLPTRLGAEDQMVLAAFATDDLGSAQAALLPRQPVTIFPVENPAFTTNGPSVYSAMESLASLEGGGSPLYAAVGQMIEFTAGAAPPHSRPAVVVVTGSGAGDCAGPADCPAKQDALLEHSTSTGVAVVAVELAGPDGRFDRKGLGPIAQGERGTVFWAEDAQQVPTILGRVAEVLDGRHAAMDVTIQLESPVAGAFASGNTVGGTLQVIVCPWDCDVRVSVPFGLRVP